MRSFNHLQSGSAQLLLTLLFVGTISLNLVSCGYSQDHQKNKVVVQKGTIARDVDVEQFAVLIKEKKGLLLDVRTPKEVAEGKIPGATNIDYYSDQFKEDVAKLDKDQPVMVYCRSGHRSGNTMALMKELGFKEIYNLNGGFMAWQAKGKEIEK